MTATAATRGWYRMLERSMFFPLRCLSEKSGVVASRFTGHLFGSCQYAVNAIAVNVSEAVVVTLEAICQLCVVVATHVQIGRIEIVDVHRVAVDVVRDVVGFVVGHAACDAGAVEPDRVAAGMMIAAVVLGGQRPL